MDNKGQTLVTFVLILPIILLILLCVIDYGLVSIQKHEATSSIKDSITYALKNSNSDNIEEKMKNLIYKNIDENKIKSILGASMSSNQLLFEKSANQAHYKDDAEPYDYYETLLPNTVMKLWEPNGGTGKTINTLNLAGIYSKMQKKVLIIDLDLYSGDIAAILNLNNTKDIYNIFEDLNNNNFNEIDNYMTKYNDYIDVLCAPNDPRFANRINGSIVNFILSKVSKKYDVILIDTNHFLNSINLTAFDRSTEIIYILKNDLMNLKSMKTMVSIYSNMNRDNYKILLYDAINRNKGAYSNMDIRNVIKHELDYIIPNSFYIKNINQEILKGNILTLSNISNHHAKTMNIYKNIANNLLEKVKYEK